MGVGGTARGLIARVLLMAALRGGLRGEGRGPGMRSCRVGAKGLLGVGSVTRVWSWDFMDGGVVAVGGDSGTAWVSGFGGLEVFGFGVRRGFQMRGLR